MGAARQDRGNAHGGLALLQENEAGDVECHQFDQAARPALPYTQGAEDRGDLLPRWRVVGYRRDTTRDHPP